MIAWDEVPIEPNAMWKQGAKENAKNGEVGWLFPTALQEFPKEKD